MGKESAGDRPELLGRSNEVRRLEKLIAGSGRLLLSGPPGIGKTALLDLAADRAAEHGLTVVRAAGSPAEQHIPYASLHQVLLPLLDHLDRLPGPHQHALNAAFGFGDDGCAPRALFVGLGALGLLGRLGNRTLVVLDDLQWMDAASLTAMMFLWRRAPRILAASRAEEPFSWPHDPEESIVLAPLGTADARALALRQGASLQVVLELSAGNPLALTELPHAVRHATGDLPLQTRLERVFAARLDSLSPEARCILLIAAVHETGPATEVMAASAGILGHDPGRPALAEAVGSGLITTVQKRFVFSHPLARLAVIRATDVLHLRDAHLAVAATAHDPFTTVWHRAQAAAGPDDDLADSLEQAAGQARRSGAMSAARSALLRAAELSSNIGRRAELLLTAAEVAYELGDPEDAARLAEEVRALGTAPAGRVARLTGEVEISHAQAVLAQGDHALAADLLGEVARSVYRAATPSATVLQLAARLRLPAGDPRPPFIRALLSPVDAHFATDALGAMAAGDFNRALMLASSAAQRHRQQGRLGFLPEALALMALSAALLGRWDEVEAPAQEAEQTGQPAWAHTAMLARAIRVGGRGQQDLALALISRAIDFAMRTGNIALLDSARLAKGLAYLGANDPANAYQVLIARIDSNGPYFHPQQYLWGLDLLAEAAVGAGLTESARRRLADVLNDEGTMARALLSPGPDSFLAATAAARGAPAWTRARLDLHHAMWLRRQGRPAEARDLLEPALAMFREMGARAWQQHARRELAAIGQRSLPGPVGALNLTTQELEIARLAAEGLSNKEIALRMFLSHRTVSSHLYRLYPKVGVRSRGQLHLALRRVGLLDD